MHMVLPGAADGAALMARGGPRSITACMLSRQVELIAAFQLAPESGLCIEHAMRAGADIELRIAAVAPRAQLQQPCAVVIALQHRHGTAIDIDLVQLQRHHHIEIEIAIRMRHGFVERDSIQCGRHIAAVAAAAKAAQHQPVGHTAELVVIDMHAGYLAPQRFHLLSGLLANFVAPELGDGKRAL